MLIIANNITSRKEKVRRAFRQLETGKRKEKESAISVIQELAKRCVEAGADVLEINTQQYYDQPGAMAFAIEAVQQVVSCQLCLSTNNAKALEAGLATCRRTPIVNYAAFDEAKLQKTLPLVARHEAELILLLTDPAMPSDAREMLGRAAVLLGAANEAGITNSRILVDPGLVHITSGTGPRQFVEILDFLRALPEAFEPEIRSICWISNASAGIPSRLRPVVETAVLATLSGLGLSSACLDVLKREHMRMVRMVRILKNELIFSKHDLEL